MRKASKREIKTMFDKAKASHAVWHRFSSWLVKTYGKGLHGKWQYMKVKGAKKTKKIKYRSFDDTGLSRRLVGYEVMQKIEWYTKRWCPEIQVVHCDDHVYTGSIILLIPHPAHGITVMFVPQCTDVQNQFFLYDHHFTSLVNGLMKMQKVYRTMKKKK